MSHLMFRTISTAALVCLGLLVASEAAFAQQQGWPFQENYGRPTYSSPAIRSTTPSYTTTYTPVVAPAAPGSVQIELQVAPDAKVSFDGIPTTQTGSSRTFVSSPLMRGLQYSYTVQVQWHEGGRIVEQTRDITFIAGDQVRLDLTPTALAASR